MRLGAALACLLLSTMLSAAPDALAARTAQNAPSISIVSPQNGSTVTSSNVTVRVNVSNFRLVPPVFVNPPTLNGVQGHIQYVLDNQSNFVPTRDATTSLTHTFTNVSPGVHTLIAYLATSRFARYAGAPEARVTVTVEPAGGAQAAPTAQPTAAAAPTATKKPGVGHGPTTGGAAGDVAVPNLSALLAGLGALLGGFALRRWGRARRRESGVRGGSTDEETSLTVEVRSATDTVEARSSGPAAPAGALLQERVSMAGDAPGGTAATPGRPSSSLWLVLSLGLLLAIAWRRRR